MMLGGGDRKRTVATILGPDPREHQKEPEGETSSALHECISEFIDAVKGDDIAGAVEAFRSAFAEMKSEPQEE